MRFTHTVMGAPASGPCNTTGPREMIAQSSRAKAAPLLNALLGCAHGAIRPQQTRGVRVAPDAAQEHAASSAAERSGTLAQAEAAPHAQARRESSRRDAQRSCNPLVHRGTRQARGQRAAWRRSAQPKEAATLAHVRSMPQKQAAARERPSATRSVQAESHKTQGVSTAHLKAFQGGAASRMALNRTLGDATLTMQRSGGGNHSAHTV